MLTADSMPCTFTVEKEEESALIAKVLASLLKPGTSVGLIGDLGAGKTTFTRHLVHFLQINTPVQSPSFVLENIYCNEQITVQHWDLYRLNQIPDELLDPPDEITIRIVEWPDRIPEFPETLDLVLKIEFDVGNPNQNHRRFSLAGPLASELIPLLKDS